MSPASGMSKILRSGSIIFLATFFIPLSGLSDRVFLRNGRNIDGVITKEMATGLVLDVGGGTTTIASNRIASILRSDEAGNERLSRQWREQNYLHEKSVPEGMEALAAELRGLLDARAEAVRTQRSMATLEGQEAALLAELDDISKSLAEASIKMANAKQAEDGSPEVYNALVMDVNTIGAKQNIKYRELSDVRKSRKTAQEQVSGYVQALISFELSFADRASLLQQKFDTDDTRSFLRKVSSELDDLNLEFQSTAIPTDLMQSGNRMISAVINGKISGRFVLDTGAAKVSLTQTFARRLNLNTSSAKATEVTLADGSRVKAEAVILDSVQAGDARAENVDAVIMATSSGDGVDGLLGLSYLKNFVVQFDGNNGKLTLSKFSPK
jgi:clan AA aspartic protease (TIGR02281 family)